MKMKKVLAGALAVTLACGSLALPMETAGKLDVGSAVSVSAS